MNQPLCPCGSNLPFEQCCAPLINGQQSAPNAGRLMRSRYTAYATQESEYLYRTWAAIKRNENPIEEIAAFASSCRFIRLEILSTEEHSDTAFVEFKAHYLVGDLCNTLHERSRFIKEQGEWRYLDGEIDEIPSVKLGRNDPCPCGSGKKFKRCHG